MKRRRFLVQTSLAALGSSLLPRAAFAQVGQKPVEAKSGPAWGTLISDLEKLLPKLMDENKVPGLSIAIVKDGTLKWRRGFGVTDRASNKPVDNDTVFEAASVSKTVFAYAAMKQCEKGVINLDTPLTKYSAKPFLKGDPRLDLITARHVLCHTSGFQNWRSDENPLKIQFAPGEKYSYSGEGYVYLQTVLTHLAHQSMDGFMKKNIFAPFGMKSSGYVWNQTFEKHAARPHDQDGKPFPNSKRTVADVERYGAAGDMHTTPTDYAKFLIEVIDPKPSDTFRLHPASLKEMLRPQVKVEGTYSWSLGWQIIHHKDGDMIQHGGNNKGFHALAVASVARKSGFIVMTNGDLGWRIFPNKEFGEVMNRLGLG